MTPTRFLILLTFLLASCAPRQLEIKRAQPVIPGQHPDLPLFEWHGSEAGGPVSIVISLSEQKARIFQGGQNVGWTYVATGKSGYGSPRGSFHVREKIPYKISGRFGVIKNAAGETVDGDATAGREPIPPGGRFVGAPMPYWMGITSYGHGMHAGPIPNPGHPASHGCIRLPREMAQILFNLVKIGTPVTIE